MVSLLDKTEMECVCRGKAREIGAVFHGFKVRGWKCKKCKEEFLDPRDIQPILMLNKLQKQGKLKFKVRKSGNSLSITIPKEVVSRRI